MASAQRFHGYPKAREGPKIAFNGTEEQVPVLRGWLLVVFANLYVEVCQRRHYAPWAAAKKSHL